MSRVGLLLIVALGASARSEELDAGAPAHVADAGVSYADAGGAEVPEVVDAGAPLPVATPEPAPAPKVEPKPAVVVKPSVAEKPKSKSKSKPKPPAPEREEESKPLDLSFLAPVPAPISSMFYELSLVNTELGVGFPEGGMRLTGARFRERNSGLGKMMTYVATQLLMAMGEGMAASQGRYVGSTYGVGYRVDYYRPYSSGELANMRAAREQAGDDMLKSNMSLDLQLYLPVQGLSTASGISAELTPVTFTFTDEGSFGLEIAFQYSKFTDVMPGDPTRLRSFEYIGTPIRLMLSFPLVQAQLQWSPNFIGGFGVTPKVMEQKYLDSASGSGNLLYTNSPWSLSVSLHPLPWVFVRGTGYWTKYEFSVNALGYQLEAGLRF